MRSKDVADIIRKYDERIAALDARIAALESPKRILTQRAWVCPRCNKYIETVFDQDGRGMCPACESNIRI